ncbi:YdcF family protein [Martelella soudanensis]|uniref:YdcF family protein n=1 Tax=unclassified Martelella TaxID=2629616 RepID=UPI0015E05E19|nr:MULTISPECIES: YdcF family protein [unclassified Martelella]
MAERVRKPRRTGGSDRGARRRSPAGRLARLVAFLFVAGVIVFGGGFVAFGFNILTAKPPQIYETDAIVVLTGGSRRIEEAFALLEAGAGERLLISGVNPSTTPESIRNTIGGDGQLFECCVDVGYEALDTHGNAVETRKWIEEHGYRRILVVTSAYHLPRGLFELRNIDPDTVFVGYPVPLADPGTPWHQNLRYLRILGFEYLKFIGAHLRAETGLAALAPAGEGK